MTDLEFDILDELYFTVSFNYLLETLGIDAILLTEMLSSMAEKGWVKGIVLDTDEEIMLSEIKDFATVHFVATKKGLMLHNTRL